MKKRAAMAFVVGLATVGIAVFASSALRSGGSEGQGLAGSASRAAQIPKPLAHDQEGPCPYGTQGTLADAQRWVSEWGLAPVLVPDHPLANEGTVDVVWRCGRSHSVHFESGIQLIGSNSEFSDPAETFARRAADEPEDRSVGSVRGYVAEFFHTDRYGPMDAAVIWVEGEWLYTLTGKGNATIDEIRAVAETIRPWR